MCFKFFALLINEGTSRVVKLGQSELERQQAYLGTERNNAIIRL